MPNLIIVRLYPETPCSGEDFSGYLSSLAITAFDLAYADATNGTQGTQIGQAASAFIPTSGEDLPSTGLGPINIGPGLIIQHWSPNVQPAPFPTVVALEAVATVVLEVNVPPGYPEYQTSDVRLQITNNGLKIYDQNIDFNANVIQINPLSTDPAYYTNETFVPTAIYVGLPAPGVGLDPNVAYVDLPSDGSPPVYDDLLAAVNKVLAQDPDNAQDLTQISRNAQLTAAQAKQIAYEITWNRQLNPVPSLPRSMEQMFTRPLTPANSLSKSDTARADADRNQFTASLTGYYSTMEAAGDRLTAYVYALSAAIWTEARTKLPAISTSDPTNLNPTPFLFQFPVISNNITHECQVVLQPSPAFPLHFDVPAQYFYILYSGAGTQISAAMLYQMVGTQQTTGTVNRLQNAISGGTISGTLAVSPQKAAQQLSLLGDTPPANPPLCPLNAKIEALVNAWIANPTTIVWKNYPLGLLDLLLDVVCGNNQPLIKQISQGVPHVDSSGNIVTPATPLTDIADLEKITSQDWTVFFTTGSGAGLLGLPGTVTEQIQAFLRILNQYFNVPPPVSAAPEAFVDAPDLFHIAEDDPIAGFITAYDSNPVPPFSFAGPFDKSAFEGALFTVFPGNPDARCWLEQTILSIAFVYQATSISVTPELQFSLMEALYSAGFISLASVQGLSQSMFQDSLAGTVAYPYAVQIYLNIPGIVVQIPQSPVSFVPINGGSLVNCIPPPYLSPLGPVVYLQQLLWLTERSTCDDPQAPSPIGTIAGLFLDRRGDLGSLLADAPNLETPLPLIDLVNESLESLAAGLPSGAVYQTSEKSLNHHHLLLPGCDKPEECDPCRPELHKHDPTTLHGAIPAHSSPAAPIAQPDAYINLKSDFSAPLLPYSQQLDIMRSYLCKLGSSRFKTMRSFRKEITEFVLDPINEPAGFLHHLWRYPVKLELALEYLGLSDEEYESLYHHNIATSTPPHPGQVLIWQLYGFLNKSQGGVQWTQTVVQAPEFLKRTGLTYCEFIELWRSQFVKFQRKGRDPNFPICEPCCPDELTIQFIQPGQPVTALIELAVFIRLWRTLRDVCGAKYTFTELADICQVLELFVTPGQINKDFIRQLTAFQMLRDDFHLPLGDRKPLTAGATGADRTKLLGLWAGTGSPSFIWALNTLLGRLQEFADISERKEERRPSPDFIKVVTDNLDALSSLAGFGAGTHSWHSKPTHTLRFAEVLAKIELSSFTVGEILFLFTVENHLDGDDPFEEQSLEEASDLPLGLPFDGGQNSLWALRRQLLEVSVTHEDAHKWTWHEIVASLHHEFGYNPAAGSDPLLSLGQHFFPNTLFAAGISVSHQERQYRQALPGSNQSLWNVPPDGPFHYDPSSGGELWTQIPLRDEWVNAKLSSIPPLSGAEQHAVQTLYFMPRIELARFGLVFTNFTEAVAALVEEENEERRWSFFRHEFARFHKRCHIIAEHLARHVSDATDRRHCGADLAWVLLKHILADGNHPSAAWEDDSGKPPANYEWPVPTGGAFASLLGLAGTGLLGQFEPAQGGTPLWNEVRGPSSAFGKDLDFWNTPFPTVIPSLNLALPPAQLLFANLRNGYVVRDTDGERLGGAEGFRAHWTGVLLVDHEGEYDFFAGAPTDHGREPNFEEAEHHQWQLTLTRGQKTWEVLAHDWPSGHGPAHRSETLYLKRGAYQISIGFHRHAPSFATSEEAEHRLHTGIEIKYRGPDSEHEIIAIPLSHLYMNPGSLRIHRDGFGVSQGFLGLQFTGSLTDMRRTYQRVFKALLFSHRFELSAKRLVDHSRSEIEYMLDHGQHFEGRSYYLQPGPGYVSHNAYFNFNFLPVRDPLDPPTAAQDDRSAPSIKRQQAMFDWWERRYDYVRMRREVHEKSGRPAWLEFLDAGDDQPADPTPLLRQLAIDLQFGPLVLHYYDNYAITWQDLTRDTWACRVWRSGLWTYELLRKFVPLEIQNAKPGLWACSDGPLMAQATAGITLFYQNGCFENGAPRRYEDVKKLNDCLRERARAALLAYLCGMNRVPLPWGLYATTPKDISAFLLQDVEAGIDERASRIDEAVSAVQIFIERARLGLESKFVVGPAFLSAWEHMFQSFRVWQSCRRRQLYCENWIEWQAQEKARKGEAFKFLELELRRTTLTAPVPGGMEYWTGLRPPDHHSLILLQDRDRSHLRQIQQPERLGLMGRPERDGQLSWLAPINRAVRRATPNDSLAGAAPRIPLPSIEQNVELWIQAAVKLGVRFWRIAAAAEPMASMKFECRDESCNPCCCHCGQCHPPMVDEYYFWLVDGKCYLPQTQDAEVDTNGGTLPPGWEVPADLPGLLNWQAERLVRLAWTRVHNGEFETPRRSDEGVLLVKGTQAALEFLGRQADSLYFSVTGAVVPVGYTDPEAPGFRYDLKPDEAVTLPLVVPPAPPATFPGGLPSYPFFPYFEPGAPIEPHNMYSTSIAVAGVLRANCRYEEALKWYDLFFKPLENDCHWACCEKKEVPRPVNIPPRPVRGAKETVAANPVGRTEEPPDREIPFDNPCCDTTCCCCDATTYRRSTILHYLDTLALRGDAEFSRETPEALQKARLIFDTMSRILGKRPVTIYAQPGPIVPTVAHLIPSYAPLNPRLMALYDLVEDKLALIHRSIDRRRFRNGKLCEDTPYWGDSAAREGWRTVEEHCGCDDECCCHSPYRFTFLIQKAQEIANGVRSFGEALLSAFEKGDSEYLAAMREMQERQVLDLTLDVRKNEWRDADWQVQALYKTKEETQARLQYYQGLVDGGLFPGLNAGEAGYAALIGTSLGTRLAGDGVQLSAQFADIVPNQWVGTVGPCPLWAMQLPIGQPMGSSLSVAGHILYSVAEAASTSAGLSLTEGGWDRRYNEWVEQVTELTIQIAMIERQILGAERHRHVALRQLNIHQLQMEQAADVQNFLRDKFTKHALYLWLQEETAGLYRRLFELALCSARQAQRAYNYERGFTTQRFLPENAWDNFHEGLLAGERLQLSLWQMEKSYDCHNIREYELTKHISLRFAFPGEFLQLKATGHCEIELPEWLFDLDYPGQYMRRIKCVTLTVPCVAGPYTGVHCRLTLLSSLTRVEPNLLDIQRCCCESCGCHNGYEIAPEDRRIVRQYAAREALATSSGQNDSGMFELQFRDERYLPFEGSGTVSRWRVELPQANNQFDIDTVQDIILHMNYTSREGGDILRAAASECAQRKLPGDGMRFFDMEHDFADSWQVFKGRAGSSERRRALPFRLDRRMFPYLSGCRNIEVCRVNLFFRANCAEPSESHIVRFAHGETETPREHHEGEAREIACIAGGEWPGLYQGVLETNLDVPNGRKHGGSFIFPDHLTDICEVYVICHYRAIDTNPCHAPCCHKCTGDCKCGGNCHCCDGK